MFSKSEIDSFLHSFVIEILTKALFYDSHCQEKDEIFVQTLNI